MLFLYKKGQVFSAVHHQELPISVWNSLSGPPVFAAWIMPVELILEDRNELPE